MSIVVKSIVAKTSTGLLELRYDVCVAYCRSVSTAIPKIRNGLLFHMAVSCVWNVVEGIEAWEFILASCEA